MKLRGRHRVTPEFSMASITDVIFLLLTFFMLTATASLSALNVKLPNSKGSETLSEVTYVSISKDGKFYLDEKEIPKVKLEIAIQNKFRNKKNPSFVIAADENSLHKDVVFVMSIANKNKYKIVIATEPKSE